MFYFPNVSTAPCTTLQETDPGAAKPQRSCLLQPSPRLATGADPAGALPFSPKFPLLLQSAPLPAGQEQGIDQGRAVPQPRCCRGQKDGTLPHPHALQDSPWHLQLMVRNVSAEAGGAAHNSQNIYTRCLPD